MQPNAIAVEQLFQLQTTVLSAVPTCPHQVLIFTLSYERVF
jgi:hypothetical protein